MLVHFRRLTSEVLQKWAGGHHRGSMNAERVALSCAMLFLTCSPVGGFAPTSTLLQQATRCVHSQLQRRGATSPLASRSVAFREAVPASGRRAFSGHRSTPLCTSLGMTATTDATGAASTVIEVGGREVILDDKSLREAFEKSDDDSQVNRRV